MKIATIGLGLRAAHILGDVVAAIDAAEIVASADPNTHEPIEEILNASGAVPARRYEDAAGMLAKETVDLLIIASPNMMHLEHITLALETDIPHIFVEKPVVTTFEDTLALAKLVVRKKANHRLMVGLVLRYSPLYKALLESQKNGDLGEIMSIEASEHIAPYHGSFFMRDWRRLDKYAGGFLLEKCCHDLDLYQNLVGSRPKKVASFGGRKKYVPSRKPNHAPEYYKVKVPIWESTDDPYNDESEIIDYQTVLVEYETGESLAFHTNLNTPDEFRRFCVIGTDGMAEGDFIRNFYRVTDAEFGETKEIISPPDAALDLKGHYGADRQMVVDIFAYISGEPSKTIVPIRDALEAGITAIAADIARKESRVVDLGEFWRAFDEAFGTKEHAA